jgi:hypothetical protein
MSWEAKVSRVNELVKVIKDAEAELAALFGGEQPKRKWTRRAASEQAQEKAPA